MIVKCLSCNRFFTSKKNTKELTANGWLTKDPYRIFYRFLKIDFTKNKRSWLSLRDCFAFEVIPKICNLRAICDSYMVILQLILYIKIKALLHLKTIFLHRFYTLIQNIDN